MINLYIYACQCEESKFWQEVMLNYDVKTHHEFIAEQLKLGRFVIWIMRGCEKNRVYIAFDNALLTMPLQAIISNLGCRWLYCEVTKWDGWSIYYNSGDRIGEFNSIEGEKNLLWLMDDLRTHWSVGGKIFKYFEHWPEEDDDAVDERAYPEDRFSKGDSLQALDLLKKLGINVPTKVTEDNSEYLVAK